MVATGQMSNQPTVHIWDSKTLQIKGTITHPLKQGVSHVVFSTKGDRLAVCCTNKNRSIYIFDITKVF